MSKGVISYRPPHEYAKECKDKKIFVDTGWILDPTLPVLHAGKLGEEIHFVFQSEDSADTFKEAKEKQKRGYDKYKSSMKKGAKYYKIDSLKICNSDDGKIKSCVFHMPKTRFYFLAWDRRFYYEP